MEVIRQWAMVVCSAAVLSGIVSCLLPQGSGGRAGKTAVALFFLCSLAWPLRQSLGSIRLDWPELQEEQQNLQADLQEQTENLAYSLAESHINELILQELERQEIEGEIRLRWEEDGDISVQLTLSESYKDREEELRSLLRQNWGIKTVEFQWQEE